jgi:hypothetical protein
LSALRSRQRRAEQAGAVRTVHDAVKMAADNRCQTHRYNGQPIHKPSVSAGC